MENTMNGLNSIQTIMDESLNIATPEDRATVMYYTALGDISMSIVNYRYEHDMSQQQLAEKLGVSQTVISRFEQGVYNLSLKNIANVFSKLDLAFSFNIQKVSEMVSTVSSCDEDVFMKLISKIVTPEKVELTPQEIPEDDYECPLQLDAA